MSDTWLEKAMEMEYHPTEIRDLEDTGFSDQQIHDPIFRLGFMAAKIRQNAIKRVVDSGHGQSHGLG